MSKGKHAVTAANRRAAIAEELADCLSGELAEAKERARKAEAAAEAVPALKAKVVDLMRQVDEGTSDKLEQERHFAAAHAATYTANLEKVARVALDAAKRGAEGLTTEEWAVISGAGVDLAKIDPLFAKTRTARRNSARLAGKESKAKAFHEDARAVTEKFGEGIDRAGLAS